VTVWVSIFLLSACASMTSDSTSGSTANTTESFSDLTSSVSGSSSDDGEETQKAEVLAFVKLNYNRVRSDIAIGEGEHLEALATLLAVDKAKHSQFYAMTKNNFNQLFNSSDTTAEDFVAHLYLELSQEKI